MGQTAVKERCARLFNAQYGAGPAVVASAPGRLEVLGNHTDYNAGLALSCAVGFRCYAAMSVTDRPAIRLASTAMQGGAQEFPLENLSAKQGHWANYVLGLVDALQQRGHVVPGLDVLIDSAVPRSAGVSSSAALEMAVLVGLVDLMGLDLPAIELARIGQASESLAVGAQTGLLDQLSVLLGQRDHLLEIDFLSLATRTARLPEGWCFVAVDSGGKHDLTREYNQRRASCEQAAAAMGVATLREADTDLLASHRGVMSGDAWRCAQHVVAENERVRQAQAALRDGDVLSLGRAMFASHESSRSSFCNSCDALDVLVDYAQQDARCIGARLSGGGFGGITIHLVRETEAPGYLHDLLEWIKQATQQDRWATICQLDAGARLEVIE